MEVEIEGLAYSPTSNGLDDDEIYVRSNNELDIDDEILNLFSNYAETIIEKKDTDKVTVGHFEEEEPEMNEKLSSLESLSFDNNVQESYQKLESQTKSLALRLKNDIDKRMSDAYLFVLKTKVSPEEGREENAVVLLKLNVEEVHRSTIDESEQELKYEEIENALPEPSGLQKGATYPIIDVPEFSRDGELKIFQQDGKAQYFEEFFDCITTKSSKEQFNDAIKAIESLKEDKKGEELDTRDIGQIRQQVSDSDDGVATAENVHNAAQEVLGDDYDEEEFRDRLFEEGRERIQMDSSESPQKITLEIDDEIKIKLPIEKLESDNVEIEEPNTEMDNWTVNIQGSKLEKSYN